VFERKSGRHCAISANPWYFAFARAVGLACLPGRVQRRTQGCDFDSVRLHSMTQCSGPQLLNSWGETKLEGAVTTDICGKRDSHATRLDAEAQETIKNARLHRKAITAISRVERGQAKTDATVQKSVSRGRARTGHRNVETALEALTEACYYLQLSAIAITSV